MNETLNSKPKLKICCTEWALLKSRQVQLIFQPSKTMRFTSTEILKFQTLMKMAETVLHSAIAEKVKIIEREKWLLNKKQLNFKLQRRITIMEPSTNSDEKQSLCWELFQPNMVMVLLSQVRLKTRLPPRANLWAFTAKVSSLSLNRILRLTHMEIQ